MKQFIYADNAATTKMSDVAVKAMLPYLQEIYANASSLHLLGQRSAAALFSARQQVAQVLNCAPKEVFFTSGGSEADNQALISAAALGQKQGKCHIVSTAMEHHAILHTLEALQAEGFTVTLLRPQADGIVTATQVAEAITDTTCLVSVMYANNETGAIQPIREIGALCRKRVVLSIPMPCRPQAILLSTYSAITSICFRCPRTNSMDRRASAFYSPRAIFSLQVLSAAAVRSAASVPVPKTFPASSDLPQRLKMHRKICSKILLISQVCAMLCATA